MAEAPAAAAPMDDDDDGAMPAAGADSGIDDGGEGEDEGSDKPTVLLTVMDNHDGTYTLIEGDEDDEGAEGGATPPAAMGDEAEPQGKTYDSPGALLKGILDIVKEAEESEGGVSGQDNFEAGYDGGAAASPPKMTMQQKY